MCQLRQALGGEISRDTQTLAIRGAHIVLAAGQPRTADPITELHELASLLVALQDEGALTRRAAEQRVAWLPRDVIDAQRDLRTCAELIGGGPVGERQLLELKALEGQRGVAGAENLRHRLAVRSQRRVGMHHDAVAYQGAGSGGSIVSSARPAPADFAATSVTAWTTLTPSLTRRPRTSRCRPGSRPSGAMATGSESPATAISTGYSVSAERLGLAEHRGETRRLHEYRE